MILSICLSPALQRSLFFENLAWQRVNRAIKTIYGVGGKGVNVSRILQQLKEKSILILPIGGDIGRRVIQILDDEAINHQAVITPRQTRICSTLLDNSQNTHTEIVEESPLIEERSVSDILHIYQEQIQFAQFVVLSGSVPGGFPDSIYKTMTQYANQRQIPVILDSVGVPFHEALSEQPWLVKPNRLELEKYANKTLSSQKDVMRAMLLLKKSGAQNVLVTSEGPDALLLYKNEFYLFSNPNLNVVNSIGSGDALAAGIACFLVRKKSVFDAFKYGMACAGANVLTPLAGHVNFEDVERIYNQVEYHHLQDPDVEE